MYVALSDTLIWYHKSAGYERTESNTFLCLAKCVWRLGLHASRHVNPSMWRRCSETAKYTNKTRPNVTPPPCEFDRRRLEGVIDAPFRRLHRWGRILAHNMTDPCSCERVGTRGVNHPHIQLRLYMRLIRSLLREAISKIGTMFGLLI